MYIHRLAGEAVVSTPLVVDVACVEVAAVDVAHVDAAGCGCGLRRRRWLSMWLQCYGLLCVAIKNHIKGGLHYSRYSKMFFPDAITVTPAKVAINILYIREAYI
jgi:uncharacterized protein YqkB